MNLNLLNLFSTTPTSAGNSLSSTSSVTGNLTSASGANLGDLMFGQLLTAQLQNNGAAASSTATATNGLSGQSLAQLKSTIAQMLQSGASAQQIINQLAQTLGSNFLAQLQLSGINTGQNASGSLVQMIAQALGPPGNGPPQLVASALVQRFAQVANALARVGANAAGQQQDSLGTVSDANAGDTPAPNIAGIAQSALVALQSANNSASSSSVSGSPAAPPAPWTPTTTSSDTQGSLAALTAQNGGGPTVATNPSLALVGTGADTVIGRILARAANVAADQSAAGNAQNAPPAASQNTTPLQPQVAVAAANSASNGSLADSTLSNAAAATLLRTVQNALAALPPPKTDSTDTVDSLSATAPTSNANVFASIGATPLVNTTVGAAQTGPATAPQAAPPQLPVDPNAVVDQVLAGISMRNLSDGSQTVRMRLIPETLGSVTVNLSVQGGSVNATMVAQNTEVRDALLANQQALARSLADAGLKLSSFNVNLANNGQYQQQQTAYQQPQFGTTRRFVGLSSMSGDSSVSAVVPTYGPPPTQLAALQWLNALA